MTERDARPNTGPKTGRDTGRDIWIDGRAGRLGAVLVILGCVAALCFINRAKLFGAGDTELAELNPELMACLENRLGAVDKMRGDGLINDVQFDLFRSRADAYCETEFGEGNASPPDQR